MFMSNEMTIFMLCSGICVPWVGLLDFVRLSPDGFSEVIDPTRGVRVLIRWRVDTVGLTITSRLGMGV